MFGEASAEFAAISFKFFLVAGRMSDRSRECMIISPWHYRIHQTQSSLSTRFLVAPKTSKNEKGGLEVGGGLVI